MLSLKIMLRGVIGFGVLATTTAALATMNPIEVLGPEVDAPLEVTLFEQDGFKVTRSFLATDDAFQDIYLVNLAGMKYDVAAVTMHGEIIEHVPGQFVVMRMTDQDVPIVSSSLHQMGQPCGAVLKLTGRPLQTAQVNSEPLVGTSELLATVQSAIQQVSEDNIRSTVEELSELETRYYTTPTGQSVASMMGTMYQAHAQGRDDVEITTYQHDGNNPQDSLVVKIRGTSNRDEIVILGSHIDSVAWFGGGVRSPGADDNASGTATNLEIFRIIMANGFRFERSIEIHGYSAEEIGLVGSQDIAAAYKDAGKQVVAMVQHDMNLYNPDPEPKIWFVSNNTNSVLNRRLSELVDGYLNASWDTKRLSGGNSDHYSWTSNGFAAAFPFEDPGSYNSHIHTPNDTIANSGRFDQAALFAQLGVAYLSHYAGLVTK